MQNGQQGGPTSAYQSNRASMEYHKNIPMIYKIYTRYDPNSGTDKTNKQGVMQLRVMLDLPTSNNRGKIIVTMLNRIRTRNLPLTLLSNPLLRV